MFTKYIAGRAGRGPYSAACCGVRTTATDIRKESSMSRCFPACCRWPALLGVVAGLSGLSAMPLSGQEAATGVYSYRHGYDPGYSGTSRIPIDPGAKLGQAITQGASQYWY